jgi:SagB-type dehydrogenase family enzyme
MRKKFLSILILVLMILPACNPITVESPSSISPSASVSGLISPVIKLPEPRLMGNVSLEESLFQRRSIREYSKSPLKLEEVSQLLWSSQGITADYGGRTAPSAGGLYPLEVILIAGNIEDLSAGIYRYKPQGHELLFLKDRDVREPLSKAALGQSAVQNGAANIVISAVYERTTVKYGDRGIRYVHMEAGHAAQNICLEATALNLGAVTIGAFDDNQVKNLLGLPENENPLYIIPTGKKN